MYSSIAIMSKQLQERPARLQVDPESIPESDKPPQDGTAFNIWYLKWAGGDSSRNFVKLEHRVNIKRDSGYTKGDPKSPICLFFARGCCYLGKKCLYQHRLPISTDYFIPTQDCFGRDKTADYKEDMSGVGSFNRHNRTLYIGGLQMNNKIESILTKNFEEFGKIEKIRVLYNKGCAFITYHLEYEAQFAKEAMQNQSICENDVLNIKWANEDPNPEAQKQEKRRLEEVALNTVRDLLEKSSKRTKVHEVKQPDYKLTTDKSELKETPLKQLESHKATLSSFFNSSSLSALLNIKIPNTPKAQLSNLLGDYSSDDD